MRHNKKKIQLFFHPYEFSKYALLNLGWIFHTNSTKKLGNIHAIDHFDYETEMITRLKSLSNVFLGEQKLFLNFEILK